jgi:hypothetical protein
VRFFFSPFYISSPPLSPPAPNRVVLINKPTPPIRPFHVISPPRHFPGNHQPIHAARTHCRHRSLSRVML